MPISKRTDDYSTPDDSLRGLTVFAGLTDECVDELAAVLQSRTITSGEWIYPLNDTSRSLGIVRDGVVEIQSAHSTNATTEGTLTAGSVFGAWTLLGGGRRTGHLFVRDGASIDEISGDDFDAIARRHPQLLTALFAHVADEIHNIELARALRASWGITDPAAIEAMKAIATVRHFVGGEVVMHIGAPASSAFLVLSGGLRITDTGERTRSATTSPSHSDSRVSDAIGPTVGPGSLVGERALLHEGTRSATVVTLRESRVAEFDAASFQGLCREHPEVLLRTVGDILRRTDTTRSEEAPQPRRLAVVGDAIVDVAAFVARLAKAFPFPVDVIDAAVVRDAVGISDDQSDATAALNATRLGVWLDRRTDGSSWMILAAHSTERRWTELCLSHADHVVALASTAGATPTRHPVWETGRANSRMMPATTLVLIHPAATKRPSGTARILRHLPADTHLHVHEDRDADVERAARILAGVPYGLVLSGGGARGFAHLGAVRSMRELGIPCDAIGGTSIGAVMALYQGLDMEIEEQIRQTEMGFKGVLDYTLPVVSMLKGARTSERIQEHVGDMTIEDLWIPFYCVSTNLSMNDMKVHDRGSVATAVRASLALPGIFPPVHDGEHFLVDGGVLNNFPLDVMRERRPFAKIIAIDVAANMLLEAKGNFGLQLSGWQAGVAVLRRKPLAPSLAATIVRTSIIGSAREREKYLRLRYADLHLELALRDCGLLDFDAVRKVADYGYSAAHPQLKAWWSHQ